MRNRSLRHAWSRLLLALVAAIELTAGIGAAALVSSDSATPLSVGDAVTRFRAQQGSSPEPAGTPAEGVIPDTAGSAGGSSSPPSSSASGVTAGGDSSFLTANSGNSTGSAVKNEEGEEGAGVLAHPPAEGVYVYATTGYETVDALGGARHDYPAETTVTFTYDGDLVKGRWDVLEERWDESIVKRTELGVEYVRHTAYHEFFGKADRRDLDCQPGSLAIPENMTPGTTFTMHCSAGETHSSCEAEVLGLEPVTVGGTSVDAVRIVMTTTASGDVRGTMVREYWSLPENGLTLKAKVTTDTESDAPMGAGTFNYHEEYELTLKSLTALS